MEIRESGFTVIIDDFATISRIQVEPDDDGLRVTMHGVAFTPDEWREFTNACVYVRDRLGRIRPQPVSKPRVWDEGDDEPSPDVTRVKDRDGDIWKREGQRWVLVNGGDIRRWPEVMNTFGPLREVTES